MQVVLDDLGHRFRDGPWLFRGVSYEFVPGNVYALTGPSGSGKSTLLSILARLEKPREGRVQYNKIVKTNWIFQNPFGSPARSALDHVMLPLLGAGSRTSDAEDRGRELLSRFRLGAVADRPFKELSGGEAQRLMLARGLASKPDLLLIDEPTAQLDRRTAAQVDSVIGSTADEDTIVIIATHDAHTRDACTQEFDLADYGVRVHE